MNKVEKAREFLKMVGIPKAQQTDICCYVLLAMAGIEPDMSWREAKNEWIRIHDIILFSNSFYGTSYAKNSQELFRKQALHRFRTAALVEDNGMAADSPNYKYRLTDETLKMMKTLQSEKWQEALSRFLFYHEKVIDIYASKKRMTMMPVKIKGTDFKFSEGKTEKDLVKNVNKLAELGFEIALHDMIPDVVLHREDKKWTYFVESVTSVDSMDLKHILEIREMTKNAISGVKIKQV